MGLGLPCAALSSHAQDIQALPAPAAENALQCLQRSRPPPQFDPGERDVQRGASSRDCVVRPPAMNAFSLTQSPRVENLLITRVFDGGPEDPPQVSVLPSYRPRNHRSGHPPRGPLQADRP